MVSEMLLRESPLKKYVFHFVFLNTGSGRKMKTPIVEKSKPTRRDSIWEKRVNTAGINPIAVIDAAIAVIESWFHSSG